VHRGVVSSDRRQGRVGNLCVFPTRRAGAPGADHSTHWLGSESSGHWGHHLAVMNDVCREPMPQQDPVSPGDHRVVLGQEQKVRGKGCHQ
jgi:hypothetical protein